MIEPAIGIIIMFAGDFAPKYWAICGGQLLPINQNQALFSILGTTYGGNGTTTFGLPNLRGRTPIGFGQGPGLSNISQGESSGTFNVTLLQQNLPIHTHVGTVKQAATTSPGTSDEPGGNIPSGSSSLYVPGPGSGSMGGLSLAVQTTGGNQPMDISEPYLAIHFIICLQGIFPSRS